MRKIKLTAVSDTLTKIGGKIKSFSTKARKPAAEDGRKLALAFIVSAMVALVLGDQDVAVLNGSMLAFIGMAVWCLSVSLKDDHKE